MNVAPAERGKLAFQRQKFQQRSHSYAVCVFPEARRLASMIYICGRMFHELLSSCY
jgi:hypothetical protein